MPVSVARIVVLIEVCLRNRSAFQESLVLVSFHLPASGTVTSTDGHRKAQDISEISQDSPPRSPRTSALRGAKVLAALADAQLFLSSVAENAREVVC